MTAFECPAQYRKKNGQLVLGPKGVEWSADGSKEPELRIPYDSVKGQAQNKSTERVLLKVTQSVQKGKPDINHNFLFLSPQANEHRAKVVETLQYHVKANCQAGPTTQELQLRKLMLDENPQLAELFKTLVLGGLIPEEEFWAARQKMVAYQKWQKTQKKGALGTIVHVRPTDNERGDMKFKITDDMISSILAQYPAVRRAFEANVPDKMKKEEFMRHFVESKYYQRANAPGSAASDAFFAKYTTPDDDDLAIHPSKMSFERSNLLLDLSAQTEDHMETGNRPDTTMRAGTVRTSLPLIRQFNRVSEGVLNASIKTNASRTPVHAADDLYLKSTELDDLKVDAEPSARSLVISDASKYFQSQSGLKGAYVDAGLSNVAQLLRRYSKSVVTWQSAVAQSSVDQLNADNVLKQLNSSTRKRKLEYQRDRGTSALPELEVSALHEAATELLHNYWRCVVAKETDALERILESLRAILEKTRSMTRDPERARALFKSLHEAADCAVNVYKKRRG